MITFLFLVHLYKWNLYELGVLETLGRPWSKRFSSVNKAPSRRLPLESLMALRFSVGPLFFLLLSSCLNSLHASESNRHFPPIRAMSPPNTKPNDLPFPYVGSTVTAAKIMMDASQVTSYDGSDKDHIAVDILGQGPVPFSISRFNRGDMSPRISPRFVPELTPAFLGFAVEPWCLYAESVHSRYVLIMYTFLAKQEVLVSC